MHILFPCSALCVSWPSGLVGLSSQSCFFSRRASRLPGASSSHLRVLCCFSFIVSSHVQAIGGQARKKTLSFVCGCWARSEFHWIYSSEDPSDPNWANGTHECLPAVEYAFLLVLLPLFPLHLIVYQNPLLSSVLLSTRQRWYKGLFRLWVTAHFLPCAQLSCLTVTLFLMKGQVVADNTIAAIVPLYVMVMPGCFPICSESITRAPKVCSVMGNGLPLLWPRVSAAGRLWGFCRGSTKWREVFGCFFFCLNIQYHCSSTHMGTLMICTLYYEPYQIRKDVPQWVCEMLSG